MIGKKGKDKEVTMNEILKQIIADTIALLFFVAIGAGLLWVILWLLKAIAGLF
ncbi:MAG: hypothetical protein PHF37_11305 [Phycisphaerae bacterium]|nr:hypothetical protein [Phycisphaerae bacterium]